MNAHEQLWTVLSLKLIHVDSHSVWFGWTVNMKPKDPIWNFFDITEDGTKKVAKCKACKTVVSAKSERLKIHRQKCVSTYDKPSPAVASQELSIEIQMHKLKIPVQYLQLQPRENLLMVRNFVWIILKPNTNV